MPRKFITEYKNIKKITIEDMLEESHHSWYGGPWSLGRDHMDYLLKRGLKPDDHFLDMACGTLRTGHFVIDYLNKDRYFGIDSCNLSLRVAKEYEVPLYALEDKNPRFFCDDKFNIDHFGIKFDWIFVFAMLIHIKNESIKKLAIKKMVENLHPNGKLVISHRLPMPEKELEDTYGLKLINQEFIKCKLKGSRSIRGIKWYEFMLK